MKNREKFAKEILNIACNGRIMAVTKDNEVVCCDNINCESCMFESLVGRSQACSDQLREWSESEYVEKLTITSREKNFLGSFYLILNTLQETPMMHFIFIIISRNVILWIIG